VSCFYVADLRDGRRDLSLSAALPCPPKHTIPGFVYAVLILIGAGIAYMFGMIKGNDFACPPGSGNLCPLVGIFVIGPLVSALGIVFVGFLILLLPRDKTR
jgi:hypothetical protein